MKLWLIAATIVVLCLGRNVDAAQATEQNAVYATQLTFESSSPVLYISTGICIGKAAMLAV